MISAIFGPGSDVSFLCLFRLFLVPFSLILFYSFLIHYFNSGLQMREAGMMYWVIETNIISL